MWTCRSQWPRFLRCESATSGLLGMWVWIPPGAWIFVCCECCVLSPRWADNSSRGVLPNVVCPISVIAKSRKGRPWTRNGSKCYKGEKMWTNYLKLEQGPGTITFMTASFVHYSLPKTFIFFSVEYVSAAEGRFCTLQPLLNVVN